MAIDVDITATAKYERKIMLKYDINAMVTDKVIVLLSSASSSFFLILFATKKKIINAINKDMNSETASVVAILMVLMNKVTKIKKVQTTTARV